ncbi:MAG: archaellin/type IV pilin N-terminal domain-containing protein [Candidatus Nitrosotenuis sp.]
MNIQNNTRGLHQSRRGVAPVIATLLLVAIAVVGGAIVFAYSQNFFSSSQLSGKPTIEAAKILGYDARAIQQIQDHNGNLFIQDASETNAQKNIGERIAVYLKNDSVQSITISELRFGGTVYNYTSSLQDTNTIANGSYAIASAPGNSDLVSPSAVAEIQPGQTVSVVLALSEDMKSGRDTQFKITTTNGAVFVNTVVIGQQSG